VGDSTEGAETLEDLGGVFRFEEVDGKEAVVCRHIQRGHLAGSKEVRDVLHLYERHRGLLEPHTRARYC
jgi:hypothetical protein